MECDDGTAAALEEAGIFMWQIDADLVFGDSAVAKVFGLSPSAVLKGLPLADFIRRVHPGDRAALDQSISKAVDDGLPFNMDYRVLGQNDEPQLVMAMGRCFRSPDGRPAFYAGIVYPVELL